MASLVLAAAAGFLGAQTATVTASAEGLELQVEYPRITRPGLPAGSTFTVVAVDRDTLPTSIEVAVTADYLAGFDQNGLEPQPSSATSDGRRTVWTFDVPAGTDRYRIDLDTRLEPGVQWAHRARVALLIEGREVTATRLTTWVLP